MKSLPIARRGASKCPMGLNGRHELSATGFSLKANALAELGAVTPTDLPRSVELIQPDDVMPEARKPLQRRPGRTPPRSQWPRRKEGIAMHLASQCPHAGVVELLLNAPGTFEPELMAISWPARPALMFPVATQGRRTGIGNWPSRAFRAAPAAISPHLTPTKVEVMTGPHRAFQEMGA